MRSTAGTPRDHPSFEPHPMIADAWEALRRSLVYFRTKPVGTIAAMDPTEESLNYNQVSFNGFVVKIVVLCISAKSQIAEGNCFSGAQLLGRVEGELFFFFFYLLANNLSFKLSWPSSDSSC
jgi:hypothetical protein